MEGAEVVPIQAVTAVLYTAFGFVAAWLFLTAHHAAAFLTATIATQGWRALSETLRADYRGEGRLSAYQVMGMIGVVYSIVVAWFLSDETPGLPNLLNGLSNLWNPALILFLQGIWLVIFLYTGRSTVTGATMEFHVHTDRI